MTEEFNLEEALRRFPFPEDMDDRLVNRKLCAKALSVSEPIISKYLEQGLPVRSRGSNGQAYEFQLSEVFAWKRWRDDQLDQDRRASESAAAQMSLMFRNDDDADQESEFMTADQIKRESEAAYAQARAAEQRGELVRAARVGKMFEQMLVGVRRQFLGLVDFCEMEFQLQPAQAQKLQGRVDNTLIEMRMHFSEVMPGEVVSINEKEVG